MDVLERINNGEVVLAVGYRVGPVMTSQKELREEIIRFAELGQRMQWIDGVPPVFGPNDRRWIIIEYLTRYLKTKAYMAIYWNGASYCDKRVQWARRWGSLPLPPNPGEG